MKFPRQLAKSFLDLGIARGPRHAEALVIIFVSNCHIRGIATCENAAILGTMMPVVSLLSKRSLRTCVLIWSAATCRRFLTGRHVCQSESAVVPAHSN